MRTKDHPLYSTWKCMRYRCHRPKNPGWKYYGKRGIKVCQRWKENFWNFVADMGERPEGKSLDRINSEGDYEPGNCRWATDSEQTRSRRATKLSEAAVIEIRMTDGAVSAQTLARKYKVAVGSIHNVRRGHTWKEVRP